MGIGGEEMYVYVFDDEEDKMVTHSSELNYLFAPEKTSDPLLNKRMQTWWTNFAIHHNPNGLSSPPLWPTIPKVLRITKSQPKAEDWPNPEKCQYWEGLLNGKFMRECQTSTKL